MQFIALFLSLLTLSNDNLLWDQNLVVNIWSTHKSSINPLSTNPTKSSSTLKQFVGKSWRAVWVCFTYFGIHT